MENRVVMCTVRKGTISLNFRLSENVLPKMQNLWVKVNF